MVNSNALRLAAPNKKGEGKGKGEGKLLQCNLANIPWIQKPPKNQLQYCITAFVFTREYALRGKPLLDYRDASTVKSVSSVPHAFVTLKSQ